MLAHVQGQLFSAQIEELVVERESTSSTRSTRTCRHGIPDKLRTQGRLLGQKTEQPGERVPVQRVPWRGASALR